MVYTGEVLEDRDGRWRTVRLGETVRVTDRRRVTMDGGDPLGLNRQQREASDRAEYLVANGYRDGSPFQQAILDMATSPHLR